MENKKIMNGFVDYNGMTFYLIEDDNKFEYKATFVKLNYLNSDEFVIPEYLIINNNYYKVTAIACDDFKKTFPAKSIFIPKSIKYRGTTSVGSGEIILCNFFPDLEEIKTNLSIKDSYYKKYKNYNLRIGYIHNVNYIDFFIDQIEYRSNLKLISFSDKKLYKENNKWKIKK